MLTGLTTKMDFYCRSVNTIYRTVQIFGFKLACRTREKTIIKQNLDIGISLDKYILNGNLTILTSQCLNL